MEDAEDADAKNEFDDDAAAEEEDERVGLGYPDSELLR